LARYVGLDFDDTDNKMIIRSQRSTMMITVCCVAAAGDFGYNKISGMCTLYAGWSVRRAYAYIQ